MTVCVGERFASVASYLASPHPECMSESYWSVFSPFIWLNNSFPRSKTNISPLSLTFAVLQDSPFGNWDGFYKGEKLCQIPSPLYGQLVHINKVSPGTPVETRRVSLHRCMQLHYMQNIIITNQNPSFSF